VTDKDVTNILVVGIGGQGVMTAAEILAQTAIVQGFDVKKTEVAGMAQRGGPKVLSPKIVAGTADILVGFEAAEAMRWSDHLRPEGVAMVNTLRLEPPVVSLGLYDYPEDPVGAMREAGVNVYAFDAGAIALELGDLRLVNTVMLGAIADHLPFPAEVLEEQIVARFRARKPQLVAANEQAFARGRAAARAAGRAEAATA
jgi:indolepyruvate ferredoxin oxidoreductase beta subunit